VFQLENPDPAGRLAEPPHRLEIPLGRQSRPVEVVRVRPCVFQMVQQGKPHQLEIRLVRR